MVGHILLPPFPKALFPCLSSLLFRIQIMQGDTIVGDCLLVRNMPTQPASNDGNKHNDKVKEEQQNELCCKRSHHRIKTGDSIKGICRVVNQANHLERQACASSDQQPAGVAIVDVIRECVDPFPRRPYPHADDEHDKYHQQVSNLVDYVVEHAACRAGGSTICCHCYARGVHEMRHSKKNLLVPPFPAHGENCIPCNHVLVELVYKVSRLSWTCLERTPGGGGLDRVLTLHKQVL